jgi:hypothetical protein
MIDNEDFADRISMNHTIGARRKMNTSQPSLHWRRGWCIAAELNKPSDACVARLGRRQSRTINKARSANEYATIMLPMPFSRQGKRLPVVC